MNAFSKTVQISAPDLREVRVKIIGVEPEDAAAMHDSLRAGRRVTLSRAEMGFSYRHSAAADDLIFVEALFEGVAAERAEIERSLLAAGYPPRLDAAAANS